MKATARCGGREQTWREFYVITSRAAQLRTLMTRSTTALRVAGSIPVRNKYSYDLHLVVPGLAVFVF